jgi:hypothetical protein
MGNRAFGTIAFHGRSLAHSDRLPLSLYGIKITRKVDSLWPEPPIKAEQFELVRVGELFHCNKASLIGVRLRSSGMSLDSWVKVFTRQNFVLVRTAKHEYVVRGWKYDVRDLPDY